MSKNSNWGGRRQGAGRPREYDYLKIPIGRGRDKEYAEPTKLSPEVPTDPSDIVLAGDDEGRFGIYLNDRWYGAGQALRILAYLLKHQTWLEEKVKIREVLSTQIQERAAEIVPLGGNNYAVKLFDEEESIPLEHLAYHDELGLYDKRRFPDL